MWIVVAIIAYFLLALVVVIDKYLLAGPLPNPKLYAFAIGFFGIGFLAFIPFAFFWIVSGLVSFVPIVPSEFPTIPPVHIIFFAFLAGIIQIFALLALFTALKKFEASRIIPAIGGFLPIFTIIFTIVVGESVLDFGGVVAFLLLVGGSVLVSVERTKMVTFQSLVLAGGAALLFSLYVVLSKFVYEGQPFFVWGLMWIVGGSFLGSLLLLVSKDLRNEIKNVLQKRGASKQTLSPKVISLFAGNQIIGALGYVVQNYAVALTPFAFIAFVNALEGIKYVFVLAMATFLSVVFPRVVQERLDAKSITQKLVAISLIGVGLVLLAL